MFGKYLIIAIYHLFLFFGTLKSSREQAQTNLLQERLRGCVEEGSVIPNTTDHGLSE